MMIKSLVYRMVLNRAKRHQKTASIVHANLLTSVAVVAIHNYKDFGYAQNYVKDLRNRGIKHVDFYIGFKNKRFLELYTPTLKDFLFHPQSFTWNAGLKAPELKQAIAREYDLVIDLSDGRMLEADVVVSKLKAKWKAGRYQQRRNFLFDFMIESAESDLRNFIHHLDNYLMNLNKISAA